MGSFQEYREMMRLSSADKRAINRRNWKTTNERRLALFAKEDDLGLSPAEVIELEHLQELAGVHQGRRMWSGWQMLKRIEEILVNTNTHNL